MNELQLIGFAGKIGSGKTEAANYLSDSYGYLHVSFSNPLKKAVSPLLAIDVEKMNQQEKNTVIERFGISPRDMMQKLATDFIRNNLDKDFFIKHLQIILESLIHETSYLNTIKVVVDDVRFENEAKYIKSMGGSIVQLNRGPEEHAKHESEYGLMKEDILYYIKNNESVKCLHWNLDMLNMAVYSELHQTPKTEATKQWDLNHLIENL